MATASLKCLKTLLNSCKCGDLRFQKYLLLKGSNLKCFGRYGFDVHKRSVQFLASNIGQDGNIDIKYEQGLVKFSVYLPSRRERCQFTLKATTNTLYNLIHDMKLEDKGIDRVVAYNLENERLARSTPLYLILQNDFYIYINDVKFHCKAPAIDALIKQHMSDVSNVKNAICHLYNALNVEQHQLAQEKSLQNKLEELHKEIYPMERMKTEIDMSANRRTRVLTWVGLGLMGIQFGFLARLTWFEYSWDIMEPVTYFVGYGTAIACYAYYLLTSQEYILPQVRDREFLFSVHRGAKARHLDLKKYNQLKEEIAQVDYDLRRLRDPLQLHLPLQYQKPLAV
ncbi:hypothetical protein HELRODRAFT_188241 [Helobdella robusta]|uniref:Calcium uniporter protein n=1 Tax=Helobdella robusta TaxID=6412 RepID=T1FPT0_HELRO|nr:hypothetical protein HELRODRAFT_188241 [Helobdella robusta]ESO05962.1 hypothetical protein HELRODRAFT_188241 [Helobdella robusta]